MGNPSDKPAQTVKGSEILSHDLRDDQEAKVKVYDFKRPDKFSKEQIRTVYVLHETVSRLLAPTLSQIVGSSVDIKCAAVDQLTFEEFMASVPKVCAYIPVGMSPLKGSMLMEIDGSLAQALVRAACGDASAASCGLETPEKRLTEIEQVVMTDVLERLIPALNEAWQALIPLAANIHYVGTDPQFVRIVPPKEMIILASLEVTIGGSTAMINCAIPYLTIEPIVGKLSAQYWYSSVRRGPAPVAAARVADLKTTVELCADAVPIRLSDLQAVVTGKEVEIPSLAEGVAHLRAGGVVVAEVAAPGASFPGDGHSAVKVHSYRSGPISRRLAGGMNEESPPTGQLSASIDALGRQIGDVRRAVEEMREDRDTLLAEITDGPGLAVDQERDQDLDRRHHRDIAIVLAHEAPATIGFILAALAAETSAAVLADIDKAKQPAVVAAIAKLADADRRVHRRLLSFIGRRVRTSRESSTGGGPDVVAEILNNTPRSLERHVMDEYQKEDPELFEELAKRMFVFEDMIMLDSKAIVKVAALIEPEELALSLKGMPDEVKSHILDSLDETLRDSVKEHYDSIGSVRRRDAEAVQRDIIEELRVLEQKGEIKIARLGEDEVIE